MTIDERLEFLVQSTESLHATVMEQTGQIDKQGAQINALYHIVFAHQERLDKIEGKEN